MTGAGHDRVTDAERTGLHQDGGHRTATTVEVALDRDAAGVLLGVGTQVERRVGGEQDGLEQAVDVQPLLRGDLDEDRVTAVLLGDQVVLGQLLPDLVRVRAFLVHLVDGHDDRHVGRLGVVQRLDRLRHHAVVGRDHQYREVGDLRTTARMAVNAS